MSNDPDDAFEAVASALTAASGASRAKMFGMPCLKIGGKAFAGFQGGAMAFKLRGEAHAEALLLPGARLFDPSGRGRPMKEWVELPAAHAARWHEFGQRALATVAEAS